MSGIQFGKEIKKLRNAVGISSRELSSKVGKAPAYVSQLERGLIKNPDYDTCYDLLKLLGVQEGIIDTMLQHYGIDSPQLVELQIQRMEEQAEEEEYKHKTNFYARKFERLTKEVHSISTALLDLISNDLDKADKVIGNLLALTEDEDSFEFFCDLFEHNLSRLERKNQLKILRYITECVNEDNLEHLERLIKKEDEK